MRLTLIRGDRSQETARSTPNWGSEFLFIIVMLNDNCFPRVTPCLTIVIINIYPIINVAWTPPGPHYQHAMHLGK